MAASRETHHCIGPQPLSPAEFDAFVHSRIDTLRAYNDTFSQKELAASFHDPSWLNDESQQKVLANRLQNFVDKGLLGKVDRGLYCIERNFPYLSELKESAQIAVDVFNAIMARGGYAERIEVLDEIGRMPGGGGVLGDDGEAKHTWVDRLLPKCHVIEALPMDTLSGAHTMWSLPEAIRYNLPLAGSKLAYEMSLFARSHASVAHEGKVFTGPEATIAEQWRRAQIGDNLDRAVRLSRFKGDYAALCADRELMFALDACFRDSTYPVPDADTDEMPPLRSIYHEAVDEIGKPVFLAILLEKHVASGKPLIKELSARGWQALGRTLKLHPAFLSRGASVPCSSYRLPRFDEAVLKIASRTGVWVETDTSEDV